ncbi:MAG: hypothetical protein M1832_000304 [Thelocarpon impressellum]|nr:MAG: hypothetical protein M1832_000304 [Thelocarpon impressellum]
METAVEGQWEGKLIDYAFLTLWEEKRLEDLGRRLEIERSGRGRDSPTRTQFDLSPLTADVRGCLLPRLRGPSELASVLVPTSTTVENMRALSEAALSQDPVLITGLAGSGKTAMVSDLARELGADRSMLTLHLNEQTDAKLLVGMYTTASTPGSFVWRAGVLTTAVREGRWVLIEDLDRAPTEVLSVVLPLLERRELLIPSREEVVRAARTFKIFATMRASLSFRGEETLPGSNMLGGLLWRRLKIKTPSFAEIREILSATFPLLRSHLPMIMNVYSRVQALSAEPSFVSKSKISLGRPLTLRDILKWCRRIDALLRTAEAQTGSEPVTERIRDDIFKEAADCLAGSLQTEEARTAVTRRIGEEMHFPPSRVEHFLQAHEPRLSTAPKNIRVGRTSLEKSDTARSSRKRKSLGLRPFAPTPHTLRLLEKVAVAVNMAEPVLLVGETGTGKTTVVQQLAEYVGQTLTVVNLSQQSEGGDLLGGFKPIDARTVAMPLKDEFDDLFDLTFSSKKNQRYLDLLGKSVVKGQWTRALTLWKEALTMSRGIFGSPTSSTPSSPGQESSQPKKRRRLISGDHEDLRARWGRFEQAVKSLESQLSAGPKNFAFKFVEGNIVRAARKGEWVLLDEINLASPDTLESIADLVHNGPGGSPSILLSESGDIERIRAHPNFRIFGAMNPATDVGKKDLPMGLRSGFTEFFVESPDRDLANLLKMVEVYLKDFNADDRPAASDVARLHIDVRMLADQDCLVDGANQRPHFSLRTLTRTLTYVADIAPTYGLRRALYEGFSMSLLTVLDLASAKVVVPLIDKRILGNHRNVRALLGQVPRAPLDGKQYVQFEHYWMLKGDHNVEEQPHYIITPFVRRNMLNLIRATSTRRFPVLIQGPTSSGKTSMIEYLAKVSGNKFVRINNHEHTDLQEYLGMYTSGEDGQLRFQEGILVQALREGSWVVLDELNLAPTDVLEALNRLLDDNRELLIPETQTIVRPHPNFMLFATQNPPGLYGGRKILSRAFRNRFLELHFDDIPDDELETILRERTQIAPSFCTRIVAVYKELSLLRQSDRVFEQRNSFATLRDLFRWALRDADDKDQLAANGFMLLAERVRKPDERLAVKQVIEKVMRVKIDEQALYSGDDILSVSSRDQDRSRHRVEWTKGMRRLYTLVYRALEKDEPVLLVGETGSGKTTVSQLLAENSGKQLYTVNAHQNTETGDLIGAHRPVRNRAGLELQLALDMKTVLEELVPLEETDIGDPERMLYLYQTLDKEALAKIPVELAERIRLNKARAQSLFQWTDGALVQAMKQGQFFLLDEISLADDSVLERLNSVLETSRSLVLAEKGPQDSHVKAAPGFQFLATMNPGGDYGKRELSPALRNRFTEIWVPAVADVDDVIQIAEARLSASTKKFATPIVRFARWFGETFTVGAGSSISIRDVLAWVNFIKTCDPSDPLFSVLHGAAMVYIDTLGASPAAMLAISADRIQEERRTCLAYLAELLGSDVSAIYFHPVQLSLGEDTLSVGPFSIATLGRQAEDMGFNLQAPTTRLNAMRVIRALKARKPILLEGSPGVGKTTLITALARAIGKPLTRINLSEQTDLMDLFGSDVPLEGAEAGHFVWRNAAFLQAMQKGHWVLLDEMNLASQSVLEGLNACLDHRGEVYVSELDQTFTQHPDFVVFATQNPHHQGGGRKGLPSSFVNRFTVVYADVLAQKDLVLICRQCFPEYPEAGIESLLRFVSALEDQIVRKRAFGSQGGPWEFNLRDVLRWLQLLTSNVELFPGRHPVDFLDTIFTQRFRTAEDRVTVRSIFHKALEEISRDRLLYYNLSTTSFQVGLGLLERDVSFQPVSFASVYGFKDFLPELESVMICIQQNWPVILVGPSGSGKTSLLKTLAAVTGADLVEFAMNSEIDTMDLIGGYEQIDRRRQTASFWDRLERHAQSWATTSILCGSVTNNVLSMLKLLRSRSGDRKDLMEVYTHLSALSKNYPDQGWSLYVTACEAALQESEDIGKAQFEWIDGILVRAMQKGKWLVLDNANICSSSVLDRLNSLLEPDGFLSMDEHRSPEGDARKIRPHSNFRIFITMDPRHGELSRAMRNRAVELFMAPRESVRRSPTTRSLSDANTESQISRYRMLRPLIEEQTVTRSSAFAQVAMGHLSLADHKLLRRWEGQMAAGMMDLDDAVVAVLSLTAQNFISLRELTISANKPLQRFYQRLTMNTLTDEWAQVSGCVFRDGNIHVLIVERIRSLSILSSMHRFSRFVIHSEERPKPTTLRSCRSCCSGPSTWPWV